MIIQSLAYEDLGNVKELQPAGWLDIVPHIEYYLRKENCHPFKAILDGKIIGIGTFILHKNTAWLAHIIVHADHRNRGIGTIITQFLLDNIDKNKYVTISLIATDMGVPIYKKLGFEPQAEYIFYKDGHLKEQYIPSSFIHPYSEIYREEVLLMDRSFAGEDRSVRLIDHLEKAFLYIRNGKVEGCYFPDIVEGLILASNPLVGAELMKLRLTTHNNAVVPLENRSAIYFLLNHSFIEMRRATRMYIGEKINWQPEGIYNRIGGQIG